jgi:hypothetical protein
MSRPRLKAKPNPKKTRRSATVIDLDDVRARRAVHAAEANEINIALAQMVVTRRALAGDVDAMIWWLTTFGGPEWQPR